MQITPIERRGDVWVKRDDLFSFAGAVGGKARTCLSILRNGCPGWVAVTASSRSSPQASIVARIADRLEMGCRFHTPSGKSTPEIEEAIGVGGERVAHAHGYNSVIVARAKADAEQLGRIYVPFGMECVEAVRETAGQVRDLPPCKRIVIAVGSGMSAAGVFHGLEAQDLDVPVLGVMVGANPTRRLKAYAPGWWSRMELVRAPANYHEPVDAHLDGLLLDPIYEAKCLPYLEPDDLFWVVGIRPNLAPDSTSSA